ncbi:DUF6298 domain-containing protein [Paenibacillus sacheonensis]|uniref:Cellulase family glycosylhydrolase n=1 Tax=Paenibacillus sacheonensis TaxID=742054 RepID=A0A7X4YRL7_9BACL|nr:cellulase family glycosylhydrolase [Paenibacillus sacheonensis]MBM7567620.1 hypothetical protein [Paenibacillus sacheonensis]NBC71277.1 cellulase family glycosylhydrolase [Paenibacillus sacheonensis]
MGNVPIRVHPENNRIFEFRGQPLMLVCATEHYGAVMNRPFNFENYLADATEKKQTLTRLFVLFREFQMTINPYSTCKPESPDFVTPFKRTGPGKAIDGQPKFDLDAWNPEFFDRLHRFLSLASDYGIIVEVTLLSNTYQPAVWDLNPLNASNNVNDVETIEWMTYNTQRNPKILAYQLAHVRKIVEETNKYDNIIYEICNEPGGQFGGAESGHPSPAEVDLWQMAIRDEIRLTEANLPNRHLIAGQEAFTYEPWEQSSDYSFGDFGIEVVNMHPLPNTTYGGKSYHMGEFMSKQLNLRAVRDYCLATAGESKPLNYDEDNVASQYKDTEGWTIHRKRAWTTLLSGCHYDYIDFSINIYVETGTPESQRHIRTWLKHLSEYLHGLDLVRARPLTDVVAEEPAHTLAVVFGIPGEDYSIYLADERELADAGAGEPLETELRVRLPEGAYRVSCYSPVTGMGSPWIRIEGDANTRLSLPEFQHDLVVRVRKVK